MKRLQTAATLALCLTALSPPAGAGTSTNGAIADAFVGTGPTGNLSGDNFGEAGALTVESGSLAQGQFQTVMEFNLSGAESLFNSQYGAGKWVVQSAVLELTASSHANAIFNPVAAGQFGVSLMQNNTWVEGTGTGGTPTTDGISFNSLTGVYENSAADQALGTFTFGGGTSGTANYSLNLSSSLTGDVLSGSDLSLRLSPSDNNISYLFSSRESAPSGPELVITAVPEPDCLRLAMEGASAVLLAKFLRKRPQA